MFRILQFGFFFLLITTQVIPGTTAQTVSINKQILNAGGLDSLDVFHVLEGGIVVIRQELDMMIPLVQFSEMMVAENSTRQKKNILSDIRWPNHTIYYEVTASVRNYGRNIRSALNKISNFTCLTFEETEYFLPRIRYHADNSGCWSYIGYKGAINDINLSYWCRSIVTAQHEALHALGVMHEHSRPDRDKYLKLQPNFYKGIQWRELDESHSATFGIQYDYRSIMHYRLSEHEGKTRDPTYQDRVGLYTLISFRDIQLLNLAYGCSDKYCLDPLYKDPCPFNGFRITKKLYGQSECQCWCHSGKADNEDQFVLCSTLETSMEPVYNLSLVNPLMEIEYEECTDLFDNCTSWRERGLCFTEFVKMKNLCSKTCKFCNKNICMDKDESCVVMAEAGVCRDKGLEQFMSDLCPKSCGQCKQHHNACDIQKSMEGHTTKAASSAAVNSLWISLFTAFYDICFG